MCMHIAAENVIAWIETQERVMRAWAAEAALHPGVDLGHLEHLEDHCRWLSEERKRLSRAAAPAA